MVLVSPGVEVTVVDDSQYTPGSQGTVASIIVATAEDKPSGTGNSVAPGTSSVNAGRTYLIGSQRELTAVYGNPMFYQTSTGTPIHGFETNEYGLMAAYSLLGISNRMYVTRADIDLGQLVSSVSRPMGAPTGGTTWLDTSIDTRWGIFEWNRNRGTFSNRVPRVITNENDVESTGVPKNSIGVIGDYAIVATSTDNPVYYKNRNNSWVLVGSVAWQRSFPAVSGTEANPVLTNGNTIIINSVTVTLSGTTVANLASNINAENIDGITAAGVDGKIEIYVDSNALNGELVLANNTGTILTQTGLEAGTYAAPIVSQSPHYNVPEWRITDSSTRPSGSTWIKTTPSNLGALLDVSVYNSQTSQFETREANLYANDREANDQLDTSGGRDIPTGTFYVQYDTNNDSTATYRLFRRFTSGPLIVQGDVNSENPLTANDSFTIRSSIANNSDLTDTVTITLSGTSLNDLVTDINGSGIPGLSARVTGENYLEITQEFGGVLIMANVTGTPLNDAGLSMDIETGQVRSGEGGIILSNWVEAEYTASNAQPSADPEDLRYWFHGGFEADVMIHDGTAWRGYRNVTNDARGFALNETNPEGVIFSASEPLTQSDQTPLVEGDLWIDTSDLENYPRFYRYEEVEGENTWVLLDNSDQTTENGVLFADSRFMDNGSTNVVTGDVVSTRSLLTSDYVDLDAPNPANFPRGLLLFNTRRSSYGVKQFRRNYFTRASYSDPAAFPTLPDEQNAWVTAVGNRDDGSPYMGRKAVRNAVVEALKRTVDTSENLRDDSVNFNILCAPGYVELNSNLVNLNNDRKNTAFIVSDAPMRLPAVNSEIQTWATNSANANDDSDEGLITRDPYLGVFYPGGQTNDLNGNTISVPASHAILRMIARSDDQSYPWFAPAGVRRGIIDNLNSLGYVNSLTGEFIVDNIGQSIRDTLYINDINPITFFSANGIFNHGNLTRANVNSALDRINVARLVNYLRSQLDVIATGYLHEPNDKITRDELKEQIEQLLNDLVAKRGVYDYLVVCDETNNTPARIDRNELYVDIAIEPIKSAEFIFIPVRLKNTGEIESGNIASSLPV